MNASLFLYFFAVIVYLYVRHKKKFPVPKTIMINFVNSHSAFKICFFFLFSDQKSFKMGKASYKNN